MGEARVGTRGIPVDPILREWVEGDADRYRQAIRERDVAELVGKVVDCSTPDGKGFRGRVVGWTKAVLAPPGLRAVERWGLLTDEGMEHYILRGMEWRVVG